MEFGRRFIPEELDDGWQDLVPDHQAEASTRRMQVIDIGPTDHEVGYDFGPQTPEEEDIFSDADSERYIIEAENNDFHCMDDRVTALGIQLPGGLHLTWMASRIFNHRQSPQRDREAYEKGIPKILGLGANVWAHGGCAAEEHKWKAVEIVADNPESATAFTLEVMDALEVPDDENQIYKSIMTGRVRAYKKGLRNLEYEKGLAFAKQHPGVNYEEFTMGHRAAGLRIDTTPNLFNNALFRSDHVIDGNEVGLFSVTLGAYKRFLQKSRLDNDDVVRELRHAALYTYGMAKIVGHPYLPIGLIRN